MINLFTVVIVSGIVAVSFMLEVITSNRKNQKRYKNYKQQKDFYKNSKERKKRKKKPLFYVKTAETSITDFK
jgi:hypothetical protein